MKLSLPYPPSANAYWRTWKGRILKSAEARAYQERVRLQALVDLPPSMRGQLGPCVVRLEVFRPRRIGDLDNTIKVLLDALKGIAFEDDSQVVELHARRRDDKERPRVEVEIHPDGSPANTLHFWETP